MRFYDVIKKKRDGHVLSTEEIEFFVRAVSDGSAPDYQTAALLMSIFFSGMDERETADLTLAMARSGDMVDLSPIAGVKADKHSTGGVGDKTTLVVAPIVAACGVKVAKMSGRGLGHTGGTVDKLESVPGTRTDLDMRTFFDIVGRTGLAVIGQSENLAPADKKLYALRDVTATVDNIPLIAASIMSKKLAAGSDVIVLDVKTGSGAFMKTEEMARKLAKTMVDIAVRAGRKCDAVISNMDVPLGHAVGNRLEVLEALEVLEGGGPVDLIDECLLLSAKMLELAGLGNYEVCRGLAAEKIANGQAYNKLLGMFEAQGGDVSYLINPGKFEQARYEIDVRSQADGVIRGMNTEGIGILSVMLGAGRETKESAIDYAAGMYVEAKTGDKVRKGDVIARLLTNDVGIVDRAAGLYLDNVVIE